MLQVLVPDCSVKGPSGKMKNLSELFRVPWPVGSQLLLSEVIARRILEATFATLPPGVTQLPQP